MTWSSANPSVATVDENGTVTGVAIGNTSITATATDKSCMAEFFIRVISSEPSVRITNEGVYVQKVNWWRPYSSATMSSGYAAQNCDEAVRYVWSSSNRKVDIDHSGNITNKGIFSRSSVITITVFDEDGNVLAKDSGKVVFYKFPFQLSRLQSRQSAANMVGRLLEAFSAAVENY